MVDNKMSDLTVAELKEIIKDWPEETSSGEPTEVWMMTGENLSSPVRMVMELNPRVDAQTGRRWADILFE